MDYLEFNENLKALGLTQVIAANLFGVTSRAVRRWQNNEQPIPGPVAELVKSWRQLSAAKIPWGPDLQSFWAGDTDQIGLICDHDKALAAIMERVKARGGVSAPWRANLEENSCTLGSDITICFYRLQSGSFSPAWIRNANNDVNMQRDQILIEDAVATFANAISKEAAPQKNWAGKA